MPKAHQADSIQGLTQVGFDETSNKKGHSYIITTVDLKQRRMLFAIAGKGADCIEKAVGYLKEKKVDLPLIRQLCIDMSPAFISGCLNHLLDVPITFDKLHVVKEVNKAIDGLIKLERRGNDMLKGHKYTFLARKVSPKIKTERDLLMEMYPRLGEGLELQQ